MKKVKKEEYTLWIWNKARKLKTPGKYETKTVGPRNCMKTEIRGK